MTRLPVFFSTAVLFSAPAFVRAQDIQATGLPNFHQVNDHIYRGGQPTAEGWNRLAKMGITTVVDLRREDEHSAAEEKKAVEAAGMHYVNVPMHGVMAPPPEKVANVLKLLDGDSAGKVFVHCRRGADRTGTVIACYRISHDHWQNQKALHEAESLGMSRLQFGMKHYVRSYQAAEESGAQEATASVPKSAVTPAVIAPAVIAPTAVAHP